LGKKTKHLRKQGLIPAILYGSGIKNLPLVVDLKEFKKVYKEAGKSSLISLKVEGKEKAKDFVVLIHDLETHPITLEPIHIDFYQPNLKEEVEATVPLVFVGESKAVKDLKGTLVQNISEVEVRALPLDLPKEIKVNIDSLETFEDTIKIKDLKVSPNVKILREPEEIVAQVLPPEKVEEELAKPIEERVEEIERVEEKEKEEEELAQEESEK
jgi:large subunit ribosomal protein L25